MNLFDSNITHWINQYARQSQSFDYFMNALGNDVFVTGGLLCALVWFLWFKPSIKQNYIRLSLISTLLGSTIATFTSRLSPHLGLPFSSIPMVHKDIGFIVPYFVENRGYETVSSFPSDHATLLFALVFGLFLVSRKIGTWAFLYTLIFMAIPFQPDDMRAKEEREMEGTLKQGDDLGETVKERPRLFYHPRSAICQW